MRKLSIPRSFTNRDTGLDKYLSDVGAIPLISPEEEAELARRKQRGDRQALEALVCANLRFVISVAKQYQHKGLSLGDLINEGNLGLMKAAEKFDETRGFKFISYAVWRVRQSIMQALTNVGAPIHLPEFQQKKLREIRTAFVRFEQEHGCSPSVQELAEQLDYCYSEEEIRYLLSIKTTMASLDMPLQGDDGASDVSLGDMVAGTEEIDAFFQQEDLKREIENALERCLEKSPFFTEREANILRWYFGIGCQEISFEEIALRLRLRRQRVQQLYVRALRILKKSGEFNHLAKYL